VSGPSRDDGWLGPELDPVPAAEPTAPQRRADRHRAKPDVEPAQALGAEPAVPQRRADRRREVPSPEPAPVVPARRSAPQRRADRRRPRPDATPAQVFGAAVKEFAIVVGMALVLSFIVKTWLLQAFYIPSGSMEDTLQVNDRVIVSKLTPGPVDLERGDIVVFADPGEWVESPPEEERGTAATLFRDTLTFVGLLPDNAENHLIKRVIGLPGDRVVCCDQGGRVTVNGTPVNEPYLKPGVAPSEQSFEITVPRGRVWVMGDNRPGSADSRAHDAPGNDGSSGSVDLRLVVGRAVVLVWPLDHLTWLSNPSSTFADVPAPATAEVSSDQPGGGAGEGGTEVPGGDGETTGGG
jgi:signal peptidase I